MLLFFFFGILIYGRRYTIHIIDKYLSFVLHYILDITLLESKFSLSKFPVRLSTVHYT